MKSLSEFDNDGKLALQEIIQMSEYHTLEQAIASLTIFSSPEAVRMSKGRPVFRSIRWRAADADKKGAITRLGDQWVFHDDNQTPANAILWANQISRKKKSDLQINHIWDRSQDVDSYTALWNLCITPCFLAKLTDTDRKVQSLLRYHATKIYGEFVPQGLRETEEPPGYVALRWAAYPKPFPDGEAMKASMLKRMQRAPKSRTTICARDVGWCFSDGQLEVQLRRN